MTSLSETGGRSTGRTATAVILGIIGILFLIAGILYVSMTAAELPSIFNAGSSLKNPAGHHTIRAIGSFVLFIIFVIAAWASFRPGKTAAQSGESSPAS